MKITDHRCWIGAATRGSAVIEQIDLSILEFPEDLDPSISCDHVLPILDSIIGREGTAVQHLQYPAKWRREFSTESDFHAFLGRYNSMWERRGGIYCSKCGKNPEDPDDPDDWRLEGPWVETDQSQYGSHYYVCYGCLKYFCGEWHDSNPCSKCERSYCTDCADVQYCIACDKNYCRDYCNTFYNCSGTEYGGCGQGICDDCAYSKKRECRGCKECYCSSHCSNEVSESEINRCDHCSSFLCHKCDHDIDRLRKCDQCNKAASPDCQLDRGK